MPRQKKPQLKKRSDGRYRVKYHGHDFYALTQEDALAQRDGIQIPVRLYLLSVMRL